MGNYFLQAPAGDASTATAALDLRRVAFFFCRLRQTAPQLPRQHLTCIGWIIIFCRLRQTAPQLPRQHWTLVGRIFFCLQAPADGASTATAAFPVPVPPPIAESMAKSPHHCGIHGKVDGRATSTSEDTTACQNVHGNQGRDKEKVVEALKEFWKEHSRPRRRCSWQHGVDQRQ
ncbi:unnamed protein product [Polarella glacialis]|uniref:Uncharacterized protein n=1 Tax=Polarella glacialis TaxID=89957 RepID=A0A813DVY5_POLGL|nr:unnamed protein product [Polarella glacialis]